ncbi:MAG TPA: hypothetical protein VN513_12335 [Gemmatimonadales bacterium]|nr:hypothetical protein [Gemmatimonadales bacterium]
MSRPANRSMVAAVAALLATGIAGGHPVVRVPQPRWLRRQGRGDGRGKTTGRQFATAKGSQAKHRERRMLAADPAAVEADHA